jgi:poly(beta-D-mannuronate) lyase
MMRERAGRSSSLAAVVLTLLPSAVLAETRHVRTSADFMALPALSAGDVVVVHDGRYADVDKTIEGHGTAERPIVVYAETPGAVAFGGTSTLDVSGEYVTLAGFRFDGETLAGGPARASGVLSLAKGSRHCRITGCMVRSFNKGASTFADTKWLVVEGYEHVIDYNSFEGKTTKGPTVSFVMNEGADTVATPRHHVFRGNYMGPRVEIGTNDYEGIRIGLSGLQEYNSASTFEKNYFYRTIYFPEGGGGEQEVVSNKSSGNVYRQNTFREMKGELSLRHGDDCVVEGNVFLQGGTPRSGGIRVIGERHVVKGNYLEGVAGTGIVVYNGDRDWPASEVSRGHEAADDAQVLDNTVVECKIGIQVGGGGTKNRRPPTHVQVRGNRVYRAAEADGIRLEYDAAQVALADNVVTPGTASPEIAGVAYKALPALAAPVPPVGRGDVGPSYYEGPAGTFLPPRAAPAASTGKPASP